MKNKEKIIQICNGTNNNPILLTSFNRVLCVVAYPLKDVNGNVYNYTYQWANITPELEKIK